MSWICTAAIVLLPALYFLLPTRIQLKIDAFFERIATALNPRAAIQRRRSLRRQASQARTDDSGSSGSPLPAPKIVA